MRKLYIIGCLVGLISLLWACDDDKQGVVPSSASGLRSEAREGAVCLRWKVPADSNYLYLKIQYVHPRNGDLVVKNSSVYNDSLLIDGLLAKDGEYHFMVQTVSADGTLGGDKLETSCRPLPVQAVTTKYTEKADLTADDLSTNAQEPTQGPLADLVDGNLSSFFHSPWSINVAFPHWIQFDLSEPLETFEFKTWNRNVGDGYPEWVVVQGSNDGVTWDDLLELDGEIPTKPKAEYISPVITAEKAYSKLRYTVKRSYGNLDYFHLAEFELYKVWFAVYDPENE